MSTNVLPAVKKKPFRRSASMNLPILPKSVLKNRTISESSSIGPDVAPKPSTPLPTKKKVCILEEPAQLIENTITENPTPHGSDQSVQELIVDKYLVQQRKADAMLELHDVASQKPIASNKDALISALTPIWASKGITMKESKQKVTVKRTIVRREMKSDVCDVTLQINDYGAQADAKIAQVAAEKKELMKTIQQYQSKYKKLRTQYQEMDNCYNKSVVNLQNYKAKYNDLVEQVENYIFNEESEKEKEREKEREQREKIEKEKLELEKEKEKHSKEKLQRRNTAERQNSTEKRKKKLDCGDALVNDTIHRFDYVVKSTGDNTIAAKERKRACAELKRNLFECTVALKALK